MSFINKIFNKTCVKQTNKQTNTYTTGEYINMLKRITPNPDFQFSVDLVDHCNLNCKGCDHFCPITDKKFLSVDEYKKDLEQLSRLCNNGERIKMAALEGGEPLLHPNITEFLKITRQYCPYAEINLLTNAILLPQMSEEFYLACKENDIILLITKYPIKIDFNKIEKLAAKYGVKIVYFNDFDKREKTSWKIPFDIEGKQNTQENFLTCFKANNCVVLREGKLYTCPTRAYAYRFNQYFKKNLPLSEYDYISIYEAKSFGEIIDFLAKPIPFCKYCDIKNRKDLLKYEISRKEITEWV